MIMMDDDREDDDNYYERGKLFVNVLWHVSGASTFPEMFVSNK